MIRVIGDSYIYITALIICIGIVIDVRSDFGILYTHLIHCFDKCVSIAIQILQVVSYFISCVSCNELILYSERVLAICALCKLIFCNCDSRLARIVCRFLGNFSSDRISGSCYCVAILKIVCRELVYLGSYRNSVIAVHIEVVHREFIGVNSFEYSYGIE